MGNKRYIKTVYKECVIRSGEDKWGEGEALFSKDMQYRYRLTRIWDESLFKVNFLLLNPSIADETRLDPTVTRCMERARRLGAGVCEITNIFALISTDPKNLYREGDVIGRDNDKAIIVAAKSSELVIAGWGSHGDLNQRGLIVRSLLSSSNINLKCLRILKNGQPQHPLYLPYECEVINY